MEKSSSYHFSKYVVPKYLLDNCMDRKKIGDSIHEYDEIMIKLNAKRGYQLYLYEIKLLFDGVIEMIMEMIE